MFSYKTPQIQIINLYNISYYNKFVLSIFRKHYPLK